MKIHTSEITLHVPAKGTTIDATINALIDRFQSTFPRRERHLPNTVIRQRAHFNPRSRVGNDSKHIHIITRNINTFCIKSLFSLNISANNNYILIYICFFVQFFWCEPPGDFMCASGSHYKISAPSAAIPLSTPTCSTFVLY